MRTENQRESSNIEDRRDSRFPGGGKGGMGLGVSVLTLVAIYFGVGPRVVMQLGSLLQSGMAACLAGVWGHHAKRSRQLLEDGDINSGDTFSTALL